MLDTDRVLAMNGRIVGPGNLSSRHLLESAFSSFNYYSEPAHQVCSIVRGIIKNHPFLDGNKRTATMVLLCLAVDCDLSVIPIRRCLT